MNSRKRVIFIGYDPRETTAFAIAKYSIQKFAPNIPIFGLVLDRLRDMNLYTRPTKEVINGHGHRRLIDILSIRHDYDGSISTEHANARFLIRFLSTKGLALFLDGDILVRRDINELFDMAESDKALMCVKHDYEPAEEKKKDDQIQTKYFRKNWSSVMLWNCDHPANERLTLEQINQLPGRDLHRLCWLEDHEIGSLPAEWNYLVGESNLDGKEPAIVHFTRGLPDVPGYENQEYADDWRRMIPYAVGAL